MDGWWDLMLPLLVAPKAKMDVIINDDALYWIMALEMEVLEK